MVGARLRDYYDTHHGHSVHFHIAFDVRRTKFGAADVAEPDNAVAVFLQDEIVEFFCCVHQSEGTDGELNGVSFDTARRKFHVFIVHRILYVDGGNTVTGHLDRVEP